MTEKEIDEMLKATASKITLEMAQALMDGHGEGVDFKKLAKEHIHPNLEKELMGSDALTQTLYTELFKATNSHVQEHSTPLLTALAAMNEQTGDEHSAGLFLGSFVYKATKQLIDENQDALN